MTDANRIYQRLWQGQTEGEQRRVAESEKL
jgi:hypothetical protein